MSEYKHIEECWQVWREANKKAKRKVSQVDYRQGFIDATVMLTTSPARTFILQDLWEAYLEGAHGKDGFKIFFKQRFNIEL